MNIKDKLTICLVLVLVIALGFVLKSDASGSVMGQTSDKGLALLAKNDINTFIMTNPDSSSWFTQSLDTFIGASQRDATITQSSAACLYEEEAYTDGSKYHITNVININWDPSINDYHAYGWWHDPSKPNGIAQGELTSINRDYNKLLQLDIFLQAMYNAYTSNKTYFITTEKSAMKSYFYKGIERGGFLTVDDGVGLNIDPSFLGVWNGEALTYRDPASSYNAQDLINQYSANNNTGVGLTINGESTCIKEKDTDGNYTIFGPFNIHFVRPINSISIVGDAKSHTDYNGGQIYYSTSYNQYDTAEWSNQLSNIPSNKNFYIKISDSGQEFYNQSQNIKITFNQKSIQTYQGRMILLKSGGHGQNLMIYAARKNDPYTASVQYNVEKKDNTLRVVKSAIGDDGNLNNATRQTGVGFIINHAGKGYLKYNNGDQIVKIGKMDYNETDFSWISDRNAATIFETVNTDDGWLGYFQITKMPVGKYYIGEVYNKNKGYENSSISICKLEKSEGATLIEDALISDIQSNENISVNIDGVQLLDKIHVAAIDLESDGYTKVLRIYDSKKTNFNIYLNKINTSNTKIGGAEFKIRVLDSNDSVKGWLQKTSDTEYSYDCNYKDATTWSSTKSSSIKENYVYAGTTGEIVIPNLSTKYKYEIYEFKEGSGCYTLSSQIIRTTSGALATASMKVKINGDAVNDIVYKDGETSSNKYVAKDKNIYCGTTSYEEHKSFANIVVTNRKRTIQSGGNSYVDISGKVWIDGRSNKSDSYDGKYGTVNDRFLSGVTVYLKNSNTDSVKATTKTNSSGYYIFNANNTYLTSSDLENYYIEIAYSGINSSYNIVGYGTGTNESKAKYQNKGFAGTDAIDNSYRLHMNIGLKPISTDTQSVEKWVDNIKVVMKGVPYTYKYGQNNSNVGGGATVGVGDASYYRTIYASDIVYSTQDNVTDGLQIYITYKIKVDNDNKTWQPGSSPSHVGNKREHYMTVNLKDVYDSTCLELYDNNWSGNNGIATYNKSIKLYNKKYMSSKSDTITVPITFKLTDGKKNSTKNALKKILEKGSFTASNKVEISGQHEYEEYISYRVRVRRTRYVNGKRRTYYVWVTRYKWETKYLSYEEENYAPGMTFSIYEYGQENILERTISGTVFEDKVLNSTILENQGRKGEIIGDGLYNSSVSNGEGTVQNVTVELLEHGRYKAIGENTVVAKRYAYYVEEDEEGNKIGVGKVERDSVSTKRDGTYTISGIIPGDYYIRFSYGDDKNNDGKGDQVIYLNTHNENVTAYDYKSTIISENTSIGSNRNLQDLIKQDIAGSNYNKESDYYWYGKVLDGYSKAVDILQDREKLNNQYNKMYNMRAYTPTFRISLENERDLQGRRLEEGIGTKKYSYKIRNMNFGIIDTPEIELGFEKVMTNIKVTNTAGQIIVDGNPAKQEIKYLSNLDNKEAHLTQGSDYAKIELKDEELYGAKLEITYAITIINNSDVNYYENATSKSYGHYYMFGTKSKEANITIDQVYDYLDEKLTLIGNDHIISNKDTYKDDHNILNINGGDWKRLYTQRKPATNTRPTEDTATIIVTRTLSHEDTNKDTSFENQAEVMKMHMTDEPKLIENVNKHLESQYKNYFTYEVYGVDFVNPSGNNSLTIIPPTGADLMTTMIYITAIAIAGIIITIGIIVIKKKVLNK